MLLTAFNDIPDKRRNQGKRYDIAHILFFSVLAILCNADSYRSINTFITVHFKALKKRFNVKWKDPPSYSTIRRVILNLDSKELERTFRKYSKRLLKGDIKKDDLVSIDGKTLRGSFDNFRDREAIQVLSAFFTRKQIILGHEETRRDKTNEIPLARFLIKELRLKRCVFSFDALHCQKKH